MAYNNENRVVYLSAGNGVIFNSEVTPSASSEGVPVILDPGSGSAIPLETPGINQDYLVVLEKPTSLTALPSDYDGTIMIKSECQDTGDESALVSAQASDIGLKPDDDRDNCQQQTIFVVDHQLRPESMLIDPDVLAAYTGSSSERVSLGADHSQRSSTDSFNQKAFIHIDASSVADSALSATNDQQRSSLSQHLGSGQVGVLIEHGIGGMADTGGADLHQQSEDLKMQHHKQQQRLLEKSHLQHHHIEAQRKVTSEGSTEDNMALPVRVRNELSADHCGSKTGDDAAYNVDEQIPVFDSITAKINGTFLAQVPGCQKFLLAQQINLAMHRFQVSFDSDTECTIHGTLESMILIYNGLKRLLDTSDVSLLNLEKCNNQKTKCDQGVMCSLLQPFISSRGRQPKYSFKAKALAHTLDFESLESAEYEETGWQDQTGISSSRPRKKRGRKSRRKQSHPLSKQTRESKFVYVSSSKEIPGEEVESNSDVVSKQSCVDMVPDLTDPLQQRLLEEQIMYRKRQLQGRIKSEPESDNENNPAKLQEDDTDDVIDLRSPLMESESTKQLNLYEDHQPYKFFCKNCNFKTNQQNHFLVHMRTHRDGTEQKFTCKTCGFVTLSVSYLKRHEMKHKENLLRCDICAVYRTDKKSLLQRHIRLKHSSQPEESNEKDVSQQKAKSSSFKEDRSKVIHTCPECKRELRSKVHLTRHIKDVHGPELRPYLCDICGKAFKRTDALKQHKILHQSAGTRLLPYKCSACGKAFRSMAHLKEHLVIHTSDRPFLCQYCGAAFKTQAVQKRHILTLHIRPRAHVCSVCCRQFNTKHALQRHETTHGKTDMINVDEMETGQESIEKEEIAAISSIEVQGVSMEIGEEVAADTTEEGAHIPVDGTVASCLVENIMEEPSSAQSALEEEMDGSNERLQQAYIQGQDGTTLYYFTGELNSL